MFARSTACRHGDGRTSRPETSISWRWPSTFEEVGRLDVAVRQARVPELAHQREALVDDGVVDLGVPERLGAREELGGQEVLAVGRELHGAVGLRHAEPVVIEQPQGVVLVVDQASHRAERSLVLQLPVHDRAADPVPAVRAEVARGEDLAEESATRPSVVISNGVDPPEPSSPNALTSVTSIPS